MIGCCGSSRLTVSDCITAGLRTRRQPPLAIAGPVVPGPEGLQTAFSLEIDDGRISDLRFQCTACVTLVGYCEALCRLAAGRTVDAVLDIGPETLLERLPGVPAARQGRALLAVTALRAAVRVIPSPTAETGVRTT